MSFPITLLGHVVWHCGLTLPGRSPHRTGGRVGSWQTQLHTLSRQEVLNNGWKTRHFHKPTQTHDTLLTGPVARLHATPHLWYWLFSILFPCYL